jgi:glutamyl-tRNA synthetase
MCIRDRIKSLNWLGLKWDEGPNVGGPHAPYRQSERKHIYLEFARELIEIGAAYPCFCSPERLAHVREQQRAAKLPIKYDGTCRNLAPEEVKRRLGNQETHVIRFKMPQDGSITIRDHLRGEITVQNNTLDDYIIVKSDGLALYHLAAIVDDHLMGITHVIRGSEWLSTFPLHVHIIRAFGWTEPVWVHLSVFLKPSGKGKMSKREAAGALESGHSIFIEDLGGLGYLPEAIVNWVALMGWSYDDHTEYFTIKDLVEKFSLDRLNPSPAAINFSKLDHFNGLHIRNLPVEDLSDRLYPFFLKSGYRVEPELLKKITPLIQERMVTLDEGPEKAGFFFVEDIHPDPHELIGKNMTVLDSAYALKRCLELLDGLPDVNPETTEEPLRALTEELGLKLGQLLGIVRVAVTGQSVSPPLLESMEIIGREKVLKRLNNALKTLEAIS